jgi:hypothetical protein
MERAEPGDSHPIINEWGGEWVVPRPDEGGPWDKAWLIWDVIFFMSPEFTLILACPTIKDSRKVCRKGNFLSQTCWKYEGIPEKYPKSVIAEQSREMILGRIILGRTILCTSIRKHYEDWRCDLTSRVPASNSKPWVQTPVWKKKKASKAVWK